MLPRIPLFSTNKHPIMWHRAKFIDNKLLASMDLNKIFTIGSEHASTQNNDIGVLINI